MDPQTPLKHHRYDSLAWPVAVMENRWPAGTSTGWHSHPKGQLLYATEGVMVVDTEAGLWVVPPNRALWMTTGLQHTVSMTGDVLMRTAYIGDSLAQKLPEQSGVINVSPLLRELLIEGVRINFSTLPTGRDARLLELLVDEIRASTVLPLHLPMPKDARLRKICDSLSKMPSNVSKVSEWAASIHVSERTLHRLFTLETGMTFAQWREQARLLQALRRLAVGDKILHVALECGYGSTSAFTVMFRRHFGVTPSSFYQ
jgi:AraC-like DNA-binding protein